MKNMTGGKMDSWTNEEDKDRDHRQYVTFKLAGEEYGIDILKVQEIRGFERTTKIPNTQEYILGVINLRGSVVPVVDLRIKFNLPSIEHGASTVIILVRIRSSNGERTVGLVVDAVSDVHLINNDEVTVTPSLGANIARDFITGLATVEEKMIILLDIDRLVATGILEEVEQNDHLSGEEATAAEVAG